MSSACRYTIAGTVADALVAAADEAADGGALVDVALGSGVEAAADVGDATAVAAASLSRSVQVGSSDGHGTWTALRPP